MYVPCIYLLFLFQPSNVQIDINNTVSSEIKCQLDATEVFIADLIACSTCFGHHCAHQQELKSIIQWLLPVVFRAVVFKLLVWCGAEGYVSGLQDAAACQLDATEVFIADLIACLTCFGHHYAHHQELKSSIQWLLSVVFRSVVFKLLVWCGAEGYVSGLQDDAACQLDATEAFLADLIACSTCFGHHYTHHQELKVVYSGCCLWYFVLWFSSCWSGVELRVMCPVCRMLQHAN